LLLTTTRLTSALLAAALFLTFLLFLTIALLAALLSWGRRFGRFIRITFLFHIAFLWFADWSFALREKTFPFSEIVFEAPFGLENLPASACAVGA
jgi:hypothetical protein